MATTSPHPIGVRVRRARKFVIGLSPAELGMIAGLSASHVGMIERGDVVNPSVPVLAKIAGVLGVSVEWLATGDGAEPVAASVMASVERARDEYKETHPRDSQA